MGVEPKIGCFKPPKMDGLFHGKPYEQMNDLGGNTPIFGSTPKYERDSHTLGVAPSQDASDHQDDITYLVGIPINLHLPLLLGGGHTQHIHLRDLT